eukprot:g34176.t1
MAQKSPVLPKQVSAFTKSKISKAEAFAVSENDREIGTDTYQCLAYSKYGRCYSSAQQGRNTTSTSANAQLQQFPNATSQNEQQGRLTFLFTWAGANAYGGDPNTCCGETWRNNAIKGFIALFYVKATLTYPDEQTYALGYDAISSYWESATDKEVYTIQYARTAIGLAPTFYYDSIRNVPGDAKVQFCSYYDNPGPGVQPEICADGGTPLSFGLYDNAGPAEVVSLYVTGVEKAGNGRVAVELDWPHTPKTISNWNTEKFIIYYTVTSNTQSTSPDWAAEKTATKARLQRWMNTFPSHKCGTICQANWGKGPAADISATVTSFNCVHDVAAMHKKMATFASWGSTPGSPRGDQYNYNGIKEGLSLPFVVKKAGETTNDWLKSNYATNPNPTSYMWSNNASGFCLNLDPENTTGAAAYVDGAFEHKVLVGAGACLSSPTYSNCRNTFVSSDFLSGKQAYFVALPVFSVQYFGANYNKGSKLVYGTKFSPIAETYLSGFPGAVTISDLEIASVTSITVSWLPVSLNAASGTVTVECTDSPLKTYNSNNPFERYFVGTTNAADGSITLDRPLHLVVGVRYFCRAYASTEVGDGDKSSDSDIYFYSVPSQPANAPSLTPISPTKIKVEFMFENKAPSNGGISLASLMLERSNDGSNWLNARNFTSSDSNCVWSTSGLITCVYSMDGLLANLVYYVRFRVENSEGKGPFSTTASLTLPPAPSINDNSLRSADISVVAGVAKPTSTSGGAVLTLTGNNFQTFGAVSVEMERCCGLAPLPLTVNSASTTASTVVFVLPASVGKGLRFVVKSGAIASAPSLDSVSYPKPTYADNSLHRPGSLPTEPATPLPALSQQAELLVFNGQQFGNDADAVAVTYGGPTKNFTCTVQTVSNTDIQCLTQPSSNGETGLVFYISIGQQVVTGTDIYNYPSTPVISSISVHGCTACASSSGTCKCPTSGMRSGSTVKLTITGNKLSPPLEVFVAGKSCEGVSFFGMFPSTMATCNLPTGAGFNQETVFAQGEKRTASEPFVSYAAPSVLSVSGCQSEANCKRKSPTDTITITGTDFGLSGARAFVGGRICKSTSHVVGFEYTKILCEMPEGFGLDLSISVFQLGGEISQETDVTVSYAECPEGTYRNGIDCPTCPKGSANNMLDQLSCPLCLPGRLANASGMSDCLECPAGYFSGQNASACSFCPKGSANNMLEQLSCPLCLPGRFANASGMSDCLECPTGYFSGQNASACSFCPPGKYDHNSNGVLCVDCPAGKFKNENVPAADGCVQCPENHYSKAGDSNCSLCTQDDGGKLGCTGCPSGKYIDGVLCVSCQPGKYQNLGSRSECKVCEPGKFAEQPGAETCTECPVGRSRNSSDAATECPICLRGYYQHEKGNATCKMCSPGKYIDSNGASTCFSCTRGFFSLEGADECTECPGGMISANDEATSCSVCPAGQYSPPGSYACISCSPGFYSKSNAPTCKACPPGTSAYGFGSTTCLGCALGEFAVEGAPQCLKCDVGTFGGSSTTGSCDQCPAGKFNAATGETGCVDCEAGKFSNTSGLNLCYNCPLGTYSHTIGATECFPCAMGKVTPVEGVNFCITCERGSIPDDQQQTCVSIYYQTQTVISGFTYSAIVGGSLVFATLLFFVWKRNHQEVRTAQPIFMFLAILGLLLVNGAVIVFILDQTPSFCFIKHLLLNLGVGAVLGSMVAKQWSIHHIFNRSAKAALKPLSMDASSILLRVTLPCLLLDLAILFVWYFVGPFSVIPKTGECVSEWQPGVHAALWGWKLLMIVYLAWITYQVRDVDSRFNDSHRMEQIIYNWLLTVGLLFAITWTMNLQPTVDLILLDFVILYLGVITWAMAFVPKIFRVIKKDQSYNKLFGTQVASDVTEAEDALEENQAVNVNIVKDLPGFEDPKIRKLLIKRVAKANELEKMLQTVERNKQRMQTDVQSLNALSSDVHALNSEIEYRMNLLAKAGRPVNNNVKAQNSPHEGGPAVATKENTPSKHSQTPTPPTPTNLAQLQESQTNTDTHEENSAQMTVLNLNQETQVDLADNSDDDDERL